jgi:hypothetical protein
MGYRKAIYSQPASFYSSVNVSIKYEASDTGGSHPLIVGIQIGRLTEEASCFLNIIAAEPQTKAALQMPTGLLVRVERFEIFANGSKVCKSVLVTASLQKVVCVV